MGGRKAITGWELCVSGYVEPMKNRFIPFACALTLLGSLIPFVTLFATSGACSSHGGVNCGFGPINSQAVCNDGWLSSVLYSDMVECVDFNANCASFLTDPQYTSTRADLSNQINTVKSQIDALNQQINALDSQESAAELQAEQNAAGRGITGAGLQAQIDSIQQGYETEKLPITQSLNTDTDQYNELVAQYNGICRQYTDAEKSSVCIQNFGSQSSYSGGLCLNSEYHLQPSQTPANSSVCPANAILDGGQCVTCGAGYIPGASGDQCISGESYCHAQYGNDSLFNSKTYSCQCGTGYEFNTDNTFCVKATAVATPTNVPSPSLTMLRSIEPTPVVQGETDTSSAETSNVVSSTNTVTESDTLETAIPSVTIPQDIPSTFTVSTGNPHWWDYVFNWLFGWLR